MRLFDNSAIRIDLFPGRKDKKDGKNKNPAKSNESRATDSRETKLEKDGPSSMVKAAKSMQNMDRKTPQRPDASRAYNSHDGERSGNGYSKGSTSYTYQRPSMDRADHHVHAQGFEPKESSSWQRNDPSTSYRNEDNSNVVVDLRPDATAHQANTGQQQMNSEPENSRRDQRRSRADIQDEFEAQQSLRTNIPLGAPHSTGHALKQKRSKADMIRATENMARTLSRSPHRSPTNRRQRDLADESRPGTSSSNGSFQHTQFARSNSSRANNGIGRSTSRETGSAHSHSRQTSADTTGQNTYRPQTADSSRSNNSTNKAPQHDGLSPTKVSGVAKKQGKACPSTIRTSPPLPMEPNKTTWSPTSSVARNKSREQQNRGGQKGGSTTSAGTQATQCDQPVANNNNTAVRSNTQEQEASYDVSKNSDNRQLSVAPNDNGNNSNSTARPHMNFSRPSHGDLKPENAISTNTGPANVNTTVATAATQARAEPTPAATKAVDFAAMGQSSKQQQSNKSTTKNTSNSKPKKNNYVDAGNSTTSPWQSKFSGGKDPRKVPNHIVSQHVNKKSSSSTNPNRFSNTSSIVNNLNNSSHPAATQKNKPVPQPLSLSKTETSSGRAKVVTIDNDGGDNTVVPTPASSRFSADPQSAGHHDAKVVAINNGGGNVQRTSPKENHPASSQSNGWDGGQTRKDSGQSNSMDFGGKSTYTSNKMQTQNGFEKDVVGQRLDGGAWNAAQSVGGR